MSHTPRIVIPNEIKDVYREVWSHDPTAIIAGGAVRDTICNKWVKDVDIFVSRRNAHKLASTIHNWNIMGDKKSMLFGGFPSAADMRALTKSSQARIDAGYGNNHIVEVYERWDLDFPANLIFVDVEPVVYVTEHFDLGICKAWYDGNYVHTHKDFASDVNNQAISLRLNAQQLKELYPQKMKEGLQQIRAHALRIQQKYPNFRIDVPEV